MIPGSRKGCIPLSSTGPMRSPCALSSLVRSCPVLVSASCLLLQRADVRYHCLDLVIRELARKRLHLTLAVLDGSEQLSVRSLDDRRVLEGRNLHGLADIGGHRQTKNRGRRPGRNAKPARREMRGRAVHRWRRCGLHWPPWSSRSFGPGSFKRACQAGGESHYNKMRVLGKLGSAPRRSRRARARPAPAARATRRPPCAH